MKINRIISLALTFLLFALPSSQAFAGIYDGFKSIYICGPELNKDLLQGKEWESAVGYYSERKEILLATGWPGFPRTATISQNTESRFMIEGYMGMAGYVYLLIDKNSEMIKIGSKKYPVSRAVHQSEISGMVTKTDFHCIYFPENDILK